MRIYAYLVIERIRVSLLNGPNGVLDTIVEEERGGGRGGGPREGTRRDGGPFPCQSDITVGPYKVSVAIDTGEATIVYNPSSSQENSWVSFDDGWDGLVSVDGEVLAKRPSLTDEERASKNLERANKRAVVALRRYCVRNELQKMLTFTYVEEMCDRSVGKKDMNCSIRSLAVSEGRQSISIRVRLGTSPTRTRSAYPCCGATALRRQTLAARNMGSRNRALSRPETTPGTRFARTIEEAVGLLGEVRVQGSCERPHSGRAALQHRPGFQCRSTAPKFLDTR